MQAAPPVHRRVAAGDDAELAAPVRGPASRNAHCSAGVDPARTCERLACSCDRRTARRRALGDRRPTARGRRPIDDSTACVVGMERAARTSPPSPTPRPPRRRARSSRQRRWRLAPTRATRRADRCAPVRHRARRAVGAARRRRSPARRWRGPGGARSPADRAPRPRRAASSNPSGGASSCAPGEPRARASCRRRPVASAGRPTSTPGGSRVERASGPALTSRRCIVPAPLGWPGRTWRRAAASQVLPAGLPAYVSR